MMFWAKFAKETSHRLNSHTTTPQFPFKKKLICQSYCIGLNVKGKTVQQFEKPT